MRLQKTAMLALVLGSLWNTTVAHAQEEIDLAQAEQMLRKGRGAQVYGTLLPHEFARAGDPEFDYLLGASALEAGHPDVATLVLERVLAVSPNHGAARLDMGRAYFALGDMKRARREFDLARALNPPAAARVVMDRYLAQITARETVEKKRVTAYLEGGLGSDDNVTQGPVNNVMYLPAFGVNFTMNAANQKKSDGFGQLNGGAEWSHKLDEDRSLYAAVDAKWRGYSQVTSFDNANTDLRAGMQWQLGHDTWRAGLGYNNYMLAQQSYRNALSLGGEWRRSLSAREQIMAFGQLAALRYVQQAQMNNDVNQWVAGAGWVSQLPAAMPVLLSLSAYVGQEMEANTATPRTDGNKDFAGLRVGSQVNWRTDLDLFGSAGVQTGAYQRNNVLYQVKRADYLYELAAGAVWRFAPAWSLKPSVTWMHNSSNTSVNDFERSDVSVLVRREF